MDVVAVVTEEDKKEALDKVIEKTHFFYGSHDPSSSSFLIIHRQSILPIGGYGW
ncbi:MAG: hypothetical protein WBA22_01020 [Candidatus Methanofastidiosia archaeon]